MVTTKQGKFCLHFEVISYDNRAEVNLIRPLITWVITCLGCAMFLKLLIYIEPCIYYQNTGQLWARALLEVRANCQ